MMFIDWSHNLNAYAGGHVLLNLGTIDGPISVTSAAPGLVPTVFFTDDMKVRREFADLMRVRREFSDSMLVRQEFEDTG